MNDTTRELGGALGIALLGSIANTAYRSSVDLGRVALPAGARAAAGESIGAAELRRRQRARAATQLVGRGGVGVHRRLHARQPVAVGDRPRRRGRGPRRLAPPARTPRLEDIDDLPPPRSALELGTTPVARAPRLMTMVGVRAAADVRAREPTPGSSGSRRVILEAVLEELGAVGYGALTIEGVAARAGVGKSTIYRHWPGKLALVEDAFRTLKAPALVPEDGQPSATGSSRPRAGRLPRGGVDVLVVHAGAHRGRRARPQGARPSTAASAPNGR